MKRADHINPTNIYRPGVILKEEIQHRGMTIKEAAKRMKMGTTMLFEVISGKRNLSALTAVRVEELLGINGLFLLQMQMRYEYYISKEKVAKRSWLKKKKKKPKGKPGRPRLVKDQEE
ncbi:MAG TPA: HigA family addiction module antitoxin [Chitinophagales bacterium]|nr:HigA family addiction module antitoxin [Chitinophagales bacterium]